MNYVIIDKGDALSKQLTAQLTEKLHTINYHVNAVNPEIVFTIGGDGTILKAVHRYLDRINEVVFIGIHTGKLGFYTDFLPHEMDQLITYLKGETYNDLTFPLLEAEICKQNMCRTVYALNEVTLVNASHTQHLDVYINGELFESFQGTGVCISTPTGSSAYNKSLGGALIDPLLPAFQLTEMASINNNVYRTISSPMIFPKGTCLSLQARDFKKVLLTIDHLNEEIDLYDEIRFRLSDKSVTFRQYRENSFWHRIQKAFL